MNIDLKEIKRVLKNHNVIAFPTDTVCGLGVIYDDFIAYEKLNRIKNRAPDKPYTMMVADLEDINKYAYVDLKVEKLIKKYMPGKITLLLKVKDNVPPFVTHNTNKIGIRIPDVSFIRNIIRYIKSPLLVPSANKSGMPALTNMEDVKKVFKNEVSYYIDGNSLALKPSTIVDMCDTIKVIREGDISAEEIFNTLKED